MSALWKMTEARCSEEETNQIDFPHWEANKNKAIGQENGDTLGRASSILNPGFLPGSWGKCSSLPCPPNLKELVCLREGKGRQSQDQRLCGKQDKAQL